MNQSIRLEMGWSFQDYEWYFGTPNNRSIRRISVSRN